MVDVPGLVDRSLTECLTEAVLRVVKASFSRYAAVFEKMYSS